jgi:hypothetical protein
MQLVVVAMPVFIGAFAIYFFVLCITPVFVIQLVGCIKMLNTGQIYHFYYLIAKLGLVGGNDKHRGIMKPNTPIPGSAAKVKNA